MKVSGGAQNQQLSAAKKQKGSGAQQDIGALANKLAGAQTAGEKQQRVKGVGNPKLDKDAFFKLMLTHVKNQDPTNPLKSHEMAAQLAQFSSLEQMSNIKEVLTEMKKSQTDKSQFEALNMIGKTVSGDIGKIERLASDKNHNISFSLNEPAKDINVSIRNAKGEVVREINIKNQPKGPVNVSWDGKDADGLKQLAGQYRVSVKAQSEQGNIPVETKFKGQVTGVEFTDKGAILKVGNKAVPLSDVKEIESHAGNQSVNMPQQVKAIDQNQLMPEAANMKVAQQMGMNKFKGL